MFECSKKTGRKETASPPHGVLRERDRGRNLLGERTLSKFGHLLRENRYLHSISMEKPRCPCTAVQRYLTHLPAFRESRFFNMSNSAAARPNSHSFRVRNRRLYAPPPLLLFLESHTTVWLLRVFLSNSPQSGKFLLSSVVVVLGKPHPCVASVNLPFKRGKSGSGAPNLTLHLLSQSQACTRRRRSVID